VRQSKAPVWKQQQPAHIESTSVLEKGRQPVTTIQSGSTFRTARCITAIAGSLLIGWSSVATAQAPDAAAAEALMKKSECFQCHAAARKKDGPSFKETVAKYKDKSKPDAEAAIYKLLTTKPKVKVDGKEEEHDSLKTKDDAEIRNVIRYVLSF
jgi:cytochrome c